MRVLRMPDVEAKTGLKKTVIYDRMAERPPRFPLPVPLGTRARGWVEDEIDAWIAQRIAERKAGAA
jgi:prophage regulatory protein